jgi:hypothetical protein
MWKKQILTSVFLLLSLIVGVNSTEYWIDYDSGSVTTTGTGKSKKQPWKVHPYMNGFKGTYTHSAGDRFYFKGGVTWPNSAFPLTIKAGGTSESVRDYYGVDSTWSKSKPWTRPIFDMQQKEVGGNNNVVNLNNISYVTLDNFEIINQYWTGSPPYGTAVTILGMASKYVTLRRLYIHNWKHGSPAKDNLKIIVGQSSSPYSEGCVLEYSEIGNPSDGHSGFGVYFWPEVHHCIFHDMSNAIVCLGARNKIYNNTIYNIKSSFDPDMHENAIETSNSTLISNNIVHDLDDGVMPIFFTPTGDGSPVIYDSVYNNVVWNSGFQPPFSIDGNGGNFPLAGVYFCNNTAVATGATVCLRVIERSSGDLGYLHIQNNHFITDYSGILPVCYNATGCAGVINLKVANNLVQTHKQAATYGYTIENSFSPVSNTSSTVDKGTDFSSVFQQDIRGVSRVSTAANQWDIGAYEFESVSTTTISNPQKIRLNLNYTK